MGTTIRRTTDKAVAHKPARPAPQTLGRLTPQAAVTSSRASADGFHLEVNKTKVRAEYNDKLSELKAPYTAWDRDFLLARVQELGRQLGMKPLTPAMIKQQEAQAGLERLRKTLGRASIARDAGGGNLAMELEVAVFDARQNNLGAKTFKAELAAFGFTPADIERNTNFKFPR